MGDEPAGLKSRDSFGVEAGCFFRGFFVHFIHAG